MADHTPLLPAWLFGSSAMVSARASRSRSRSPPRDVASLLAPSLSIWRGALSGSCVWSGVRPASAPCISALAPPRLLDVFLSPAGFFVAQEWPGPRPGRHCPLAAPRAFEAGPWPDSGPRVLEHRRLGGCAGAPPRLLLPVALAPVALASPGVSLSSTTVEHVREWTEGSRSSDAVHLLAARFLGLPAPPPGAALIGAWDVRSWCAAPRAALCNRFPCFGPGRDSVLIRVSLFPSARAPVPVLQCVMSTRDPLETLLQPLMRLLACPGSRLALWAAPGVPLDLRSFPDSLCATYAAPWVQMPGPPSRLAQR